jgi:FSR family fosmidomycin resistance protein-like MFS transporter
LFFILGGAAALLLWRTQRLFRGKGGEGSIPAEATAGFRAGMEGALIELRRGRALRWLALLAFADLMLDVLFGFLALYLVDSVGANPFQASLGVAVWTGAGLLGDLALIPTLERMAGIRYLRISALVELALFSAFLLVPHWGGKLLLIGLIGFFNAGWYSILKAGLYAAMPGKSGRVMTVGVLPSLLAGLFPLGLGWVAGRYNLTVAMGLLLVGPLALLIGLPRNADGLPEPMESERRG